MLHTGCGRSKDFTKSPVRYGRVASQSGKFGSPAIAVENHQIQQLHITSNQKGLYIY